jgi:hypothetical protein
MKLNKKRLNFYNFISAISPLLGIAGFIVTTMIYPGRADGMSIFGVFMLPGEIFCLATLFGTLAAIFSLIRHEPFKWLSLTGLATNGSLAIVLCISALLSI